MEYKSEKQKLALQKQGQYLKQFNKLFDENQELDIRGLYLLGKSCNEIAKLYKCSKFPILRIIKDLPKRKPTDYKNHKAYNQFGDKNPHWKGGIKSVYDRIRGLASYWSWHKAVLESDYNTCVHCKTKHNLQVHHIKTLKSLVLEYCHSNNIAPKDLTEQDLNSEFFYQLSNGLTLCDICHKKLHKEHGR